MSNDSKGGRVFAEKRPSRAVGVRAADSNSTNFRIREGVDRVPGNLLASYRRLGGAPPAATDGRKYRWDGIGGSVGLVDLGAGCPPWSGELF